LRFELAIPEYNLQVTTGDTQKLGGLHKNDFIMTAKTHQLLQMLFVLICAFCPRHAIDK